MRQNLYKLAITLFTFAFLLFIFLEIPVFVFAATDTTPPTVMVEQKTGQVDPTSTNDLRYTVTFSEAMDPTTVTLSDFTLTGTPSLGGGYIHYFTMISTTVWEVGVKNLPNGTTSTLSLAAGKTADVAGNLNTASTSVDNSIMFSMPVPNVDLLVTNSQSPKLQGKCVTGHAMVVTVNAVAYNVTCDATGAWAITATGLSNGVYDVVVKDTISNTMDATTNELTVDAVGPIPTVEQLSTQKDPTNVNSAAFKVTFDEVINSSTLVSSDFSVTNSTGTVTSIVQATPTVYWVWVTGMTDGDNATVSLPLGKVTDIAGNTNTSSTSVDNKVMYDVSKPKIVVTDDTVVGPVMSDTVKFDITDTGSGVDATKVWVIAQASKTCDSTVTFTKSYVSGAVLTYADESKNGMYICVTATDMVGNVAYAMTTNPLWIDITAPTTPAMMPDLQATSDTETTTDNMTSNTMPMFDLVCTEAGETLKLYSDNPAAGTWLVSVVCTAAGTVSVKTPALAVGVHNVYYTGTDKAGNVSGKSAVLDVTIQKMLANTGSNFNLYFILSAMFISMGVMVIKKRNWEI